MYRSRNRSQDGDMAVDTQPESTWSGPLRGEVVYLYAYDIAYDFRREPHELKDLLGVPIERAGVDRSKRHPRLPQAGQAPPPPCRRRSRPASACPASPSTARTAGSRST